MPTASKASSSTSRTATASSSCSGRASKSGIVSGRKSQVVTNRAVELGITRVFQGALDKLAPYREILQDTGLADDQVAFMGDDVIDIPVMRRVGFAAAPADAVEEVLPHVHFIARNRGGWERSGSYAIFF